MLHWQIRRDGQLDWQPIAVPGCCEDAGFPPDDPGPYWYRAMLPIPTLTRARSETGPSKGGRLRLRFGAASYHYRVFVNSCAASIPAAWPCTNTPSPSPGGRGT